MGGWVEALVIIAVLACMISLDKKKGEVSFQIFQITTFRIGGFYLCLLLSCYLVLLFDIKSLLFITFLSAITCWKFFEVPFFDFKAYSFLQGFGVCVLKFNYFFHIGPFTFWMSLAFFISLIVNGFWYIGVLCVLNLIFFNLYQKKLYKKLVKSGIYFKKISGYC